MELFDFFSFLGLVLGLGVLVFIVWLFVKYIRMLDDVADIRSLLADIKYELQLLNYNKEKDKQKQG